MQAARPAPRILDRRAIAVGMKCRVPVRDRVKVTIILSAKTTQGRPQSGLCHQGMEKPK